MQHFLDCLHRIAPLSSDLHHHLTSVIETRTFTKKEWIVKPNRASRHLYFIESGLTGQFISRGDQLHCTGFLQEGEVILPLERSPSLQALDTTIVHGISLDDLHWIQVHYPEFNVHSRELVLRHYVAMQERLHAFHQRSPLQKYQWMMEHAPELILRVSHTHLASYMGITLETLSRVKARL